MKLLVDELPKTGKECIFSMEMCRYHKHNRPETYYGCMLKELGVYTELKRDYGYYGDGNVYEAESRLTCEECDINNCPYLKEYPSKDVKFLKNLVNFDENQD